MPPIQHHADPGPSTEDGDWDYIAVARDGAYDLHFGQSVAFRACFQSRTISLLDGADAAPSTIDHFLFDHAIPRILAASVPLVLHGSAVEIGGRIAVFIGETGAGKSTLGASLHARGHRLLGDDAVIVTEHDGAYFGEAVYPSLRLFPDSISELLGDDVATVPMAAYSDKRHVTEFRNAAAASAPLPIACIFNLATIGDAPSLHPISPRESCMAMMDQSFALDPDDVRAASQRLAVAARLASATACYALSYPHDYACLPHVHALIEGCMTSRPAGVSGARHSEETAP